MTWVTDTYSSPVGGNESLGKKLVVHIEAMAVNSKKSLAHLNVSVSHNNQLVPRMELAMFCITVLHLYKHVL